MKEKCIWCKKTIDKDKCLGDICKKCLDKYMGKLPGMTFKISPEDKEKIRKMFYGDKE